MEEPIERRRRRKSARTSLLLYYFLRRGNRWTNPTRLHREVNELLKNEQGELLGRHRTGVATMSYRIVSARCEEWAEKGILESELRTPAKGNTKSLDGRTPHYRLPTVDPDKRIVMARTLLRQMPDTFAGSAYGREFIDQIAIIKLEQDLGIALGPGDKQAVVAACRRTPRLLEHIINSDFSKSLRRIDANRRRKRSDLELLRKYLRSVNVVEKVEKP